MTQSAPSQSTESQHILLIEDTPSLAHMYQTSLENQGYKVSSFPTGEDGLKFFDDNQTDLVLLDLKLPDMNGLDVIDELNKRNITVPVIIITGHGSINVAVEAIKKGARDFLVKPFDVERLFSSVKYELEISLDGQDLALQDLAGAPVKKDDMDVPPKTGDSLISQPQIVTDAKTRKNFGGFIGTSPIMLKLYDHIEAAAKSNATVFITGESGTGKEVCAEAIHKYSTRADKPFVPINCAAIPRDLIESELFGHVKGAFTGAISDREGAASLANGGTLFLDEIGEMNPDMQTKLLRFLQNFTFRKVGGSKLEKTDIRIICATNRNPLDEIRAGKFREDLFYRLHVLPVYMPPLRQREDYVIDIAQVLLKTYAAEEKKDFMGFAPEAEYKLRHYAWPGNIRQLQNVVRNIVVLQNGEYVTGDMLPPELLHQHSIQENLVDHPATPNAELAMTASEPAATALDNRTPKEKIRPLADVEKEAIEFAIQAHDGLRTRGRIRRFPLHDLP